MIYKIFSLIILSTLSLTAQSVLDVKVKDTNSIKGENIFLDGMKAYLAEDYAAAEGHFNTVLEKYEQHPGTYHMLAVTLEKQGKIENALQMAKKAMELDLSNETYQAFYADLLTVNHQYSDAEAIYKKAIKVTPSNERNYFALVQIYKLLDDIPSAIKTLESLEKAVGSTEEILQEKQQLYLLTNQMDKAIAEGEKLMEGSPQDDNYTLNQAQFLIANKRYKEAEKLLNEAIEKQATLSEAYVLLAEVYRLQEELGKCGEALRNAFKTDALNPETKVKVLDTYAQLVIQKQDAAALQDAIDISEELVKKNPDSGKLNIILGNLYKQNKDVNTARAYYEKSLTYEKSIFDVWMSLVEIDMQLEDYTALKKHATLAAEYFPNQAYFWYHAGLGNLFDQDPQEALYAFDEAEALSFNNSELLKNILTHQALAYIKTKDYASAEKAFEGALDIDDKFSLALNEYSLYLLSRKKLLPKAEELAAALVSEYPNELAYADTYAQILFQQQAYAKALIELERAMKLNQKPSANQLEHYGDVLAKNGQIEKAISQWQKAKELGANSANLNQKIASKNYIE